MITQQEKFQKTESIETEGCQNADNGKPEIICCYQAKKVATYTDGYGLPARERPCASGIELEKKIIPEKPVYILNRKATIRGISLPILDVLDTRNTFLWVEAYRQMMVEHQWTEAQAKLFFKLSVSKDILDGVVGNPKKQTLRDSVRKIYDRVYTPESVALLKKKIESLVSARFETLEDYRDELALLIRSYSVRVLVTEEDRMVMQRTHFWNGLSASIKSILSRKIDSSCSPDEIIRQVFLFKQKMFIRYKLPENFTGVIYIKEKPDVNVHFPVLNDPDNNDSDEHPVGFAAVDCSKPQRRSKVIPMPSMKERRQPVLPALKKIPAGLIIKNDLPGTLREIAKNYSHRKTERIFKKPKIGRTFVIYTGCVEGWIVGLLIQKKVAVSIYKAPLAASQQFFTETEKCILAVDRARAAFQDIVGDSPVVFASEQYKSFIYTTESGMSFVDSVEMPDWA